MPAIAEVVPISDALAQRIAPHLPELDRIVLARKHGREWLDLVRVAVIRDDEGTIEDTADDLAAEVHRQIKLNADDCGFRPS